MTTILALRALGLGDTYAAVPALRGVRRAAPGARLVLAGPESWGGLLVADGVVDEVIPSRGLEEIAWPGPGPDVAVNLHGSGPESHLLLRSLRPGRLVGFACPAIGFADGPKWRDGEHEVDRWVRLVRWMGGEAGREDLRLGGRAAPPPSATAPVVVHPGAASASRRWPASRWCEVVSALAAQGRCVHVTGGPDEADLTAGLATAAPGRVTDLGGRLTPGQLLDTVRGAALVLCGDTGVAHLATAYGTPSVILFGPTPPSAWGPSIDPDLHEVLWHGRPGDPPGDPHGERLDPRLARVEVPEVLEAARRLLR